MAVLETLIFVLITVALTVVGLPFSKTFILTKGSNPVDASALSTVIIGIGILFIFVVRKASKAKKAAFANEDALKALQERLAQLERNPSLDGKPGQ